MRLLIACLLIATFLAGCADGDPPATPEDPFDGRDTKATATTGVIRGVVVDMSITPVADVTVTVKGTQHIQNTDAEGLFAFEGLDPGNYFLETEKVAFASVQQSVEVVAGVDRPPITKIQIEALPDARPYVEPLFMTGYLTCGVAVFATSVGCTTYGPVADAIGDASIFSVDYDRVPQWVQGELVWDNTQPLAGAFIWEITQSEYPGSPQPHIGYRETTGSPALAYLNQSVTQEYADWIVETGLDFRFFGGPHELCHIPVAPPPGSPVGWRFGCGVTLEQETEVFVHHFYNFSPDEGWRFTSDGDHPTG